MEGLLSTGPTLSSFLIYDVFSHEDLFKCASVQIIIFFHLCRSPGFSQQGLALNILIARPQHLRPALHCRAQRQGIHYLLETYENIPVNNPAIALHQTRVCIFSSEPGHK